MNNLKFSLFDFFLGIFYLYVFNLIAMAFVGIPWESPLYGEHSMWNIAYQFGFVSGTNKVLIPSISLTISLLVWGASERKKNGTRGLIKVFINSMLFIFLSIFIGGFIGIVMKDTLLYGFPGLVIGIYIPYKILQWLNNLKIWNKLFDNKVSDPDKEEAFRNMVNDIRSESGLDD
tara:strand:+ start:1040 stop:1564 length:525 start_codon:yes stop_codon:yes gene_type:complete